MRPCHGVLGATMLVVYAHMHIRVLYPRVCLTTVFSYRIRVHENKRIQLQSTGLDFRTYHECQKWVQCYGQYRDSNSCPTEWELDVVIGDFQTELPGLPSIVAQPVWIPMQPLWPPGWGMHLPQCYSPPDTSHTSTITTGSPEQVAIGTPIPFWPSPVAM